MKRIIRFIYNLLRLAIVTLIIAVVLGFAGLYVALSIPSVQNKIKTESEVALSDLLKTKVTIGEISIMPFSEVLLKDVAVPTPEGDSLFTIEKVGTRLSLYELVTSNRFLFTYAEIIGLKGHITRPDKHSPTNMQFLIDALKSKDDKPQKPFDIAIHNVVLRKTSVSFDVLDEPHKVGQFDTHHLHVTDLRADIILPRLKNNDFLIEIKRMALKEHSGLEVTNFVTTVEITDTLAAARDVRIEMPNSLLALGDVEVRYNSLKTIGQDIKNSPLELAIANSYVKLSDLKAFVPQLGNLNQSLYLTAMVKGTIEHVNVRTLTLTSDDEMLLLNTSGTIDNLDKKGAIEFNVPNIQLIVKSLDAATAIQHFAKLSPKAIGIIQRCGKVEVDGSVSGNHDNLIFNGNIATSLGRIDIDGRLASEGAARGFKGHVKTPNFRVGELLALNRLLNEVSLDLDLDAKLAGGRLASSHADGVVNYVDLNGYRYHNITTSVMSSNNDYSAALSIDDQAVQLNLDGNAHLDGPASLFDVTLSTTGLNLSRLGFIKNVPDGIISLNLDANVAGNKPDNMTGTVAITDIDYRGANGKKLHINNLLVTADNNSTPQFITLESDFLKGNVTGSYDFATLVPSIKGLLAKAFPQFLGDYASVLDRQGKKNDLDFNFVLEPSDEINDILKLPVKFVYKTTIDGNIKESDRSFALNINAPYLLNGKKIIEGTNVHAQLDNSAGNVSLVAHTLVPLKQGKAALAVTANGINNQLDTDLGWKVLRDADFHGNLNLSTLLRRNDDGKVAFDISVNPTQLGFNDTVWQVEPASVAIDNGVIAINNMCGHSGEQFIKINGEISKNPESQVQLDLNDVSLDYVFETLNIDNVDFGGRATGRFFAKEVMSKNPVLYTPLLHVDNLSYNNTVMGNADIKSSWLNEQKAVSLDADISQANGLHSLIYGAIFIADDSLHLSFETQRANAAFLRHYMKAITSDLQGEVSGKAVIFGNFKTINLYGDVKVDSLRFKLDYTNVYYTAAGDSVHMKPDYIAFSDITLHDRDGHDAKLNGWLKHDCFHNPSFNFSITDAKNLLCYDTNPDINNVYYGTVYCNGSAFVNGGPGIVDIKVNMQTSHESRFTFVLSDSKDASEYNFITFRDRNKPLLNTDTVAATDTIPEIVRQLTAKAQVQKDGPPTAYNIDLQGDITPDVQLIIVMDPVSGDQIKCTGGGNMRLTYNNNNEMSIFGKYTLEKGNYNFTLQDIIIKDFTIRDGSSISFQGDPYAATLDITGVYSLNANIKDLDETFAQDKEITRTNVPVHALLYAKGPMNQPEISFDLEFPTLTTDAYRRIKSIISTDDMMNRQIIYLLALNRFYTPDYMNTTKQNNELTSVASSTISSQLSKILGKLSDNWSITPNFRSDRGDFSDVEVDLALSSQLLNNRLLINGNFGYRDNTYNTRNTNFIGDFDIEYLLNKKGTIRLKAYNHFNDQNYYVRNALTTQGVGVMWKHDFDRPFDFLKRKKNKTTEKNDSVTTQMATDTIPNNEIKK